MSDLAIKVEHLSKRYRIGLKEERHNTLAGAAFSWLKAPFSSFQRLRRLSKFDDNGEAEDVIWALKDISFEVKQGEVVGIIGRNGAGKSTLLKILSRITEPTSGRALITGRMTSLLEVGTGFHTELTGRENVYLNGTVLGMSKQEVDRKFDEIVAFSGVEKFIDTPVKRYSSGMSVRLAFSVAAHLEPEILLIDEVLSVGDAVFQKQCLGKMDDVAKAGRTVLFVSHNMVAVHSLCRRAICLSDGRIAEHGPTGQVIANYLKTAFSSLSEQVWDDITTAPGNETVRMRRVCVQPLGGHTSDQIVVTMPFLIQFEYWNQVPGIKLNLSLVLHSQEGVIVLTSPSLSDGWQGKRFPVGLYHSNCLVPANLLNEGRYSISILVVIDARQVIFRLDDCLVFDVHDTGEGRAGWYGEWVGVVRPALKWTTARKNDTDALVE